MRKHILTAALLLAAAGAPADNGTGYTGDGYYRVRNYGTGRYLYVTDNKDFYDKSRDAEDFQAIQLWLGWDRAVPDPASVIHVERQSDGKFDLTAQGTGVHELTGYYVGVSKQANGTYEVSATVSKAGVTVSKYLSDNEISGYEDGDLLPDGKMGTGGKLNFRKWVVDKVSAAHATNYFGLAPTLASRGKYYQPFYAAFPFRPVGEGMRVYGIRLVDGKWAVLSELEGDVPAATPVIVECPTPDPSANRLELLEEAAPLRGDNLLRGVYFCNGKRPRGSVDAYTPFDAGRMRVLTVGEDGRLAYSDKATDRLVRLRVTNFDTYATEYKLCLPANASYLPCAAGSEPRLAVVTEEEYKAMGIDSPRAASRDGRAGVFTAQGQLVRGGDSLEGLPRGLYIVNGRKTLK